VKFDKNGNYVKAWGSEGKDPGQFGGTVHCIAVDARSRRVYARDSGNRRIQVFDDNGTFLNQWEVPSAAHIVVDPDQSVWVATTGPAGRIQKHNTVSFRQACVSARAPRSRPGLVREEAPETAECPARRIARPWLGRRASA